MKNFNEECPQCHNKDKDKIKLYKDRDIVKILKCDNCDFKWGVSKEGN